MGKKYDFEKEKVFRDHNIFIFPTRYSKECFPLVLLEALSFGLVCFSSKEGAIPDIINESIGYTYENDFVSKFSEKIMYLNNNKHIIKKKSNLSLQEFNRNYTLDIFKDKIFKIFKI